jgi:hypothetical protein
MAQMQLAQRLTGGPPRASGPDPAEIGVDLS